MLEVLEEGRDSARYKTPLLFVHGSWHGAWCWAENFLPWFTERGYHAVALSLRGHSGSSSEKPLRRVSMADYMADVAAVAGRFATAPVLIGHSMGGGIVQKLLETYRVPAAVLLAAMPPSGVLRTSLAIAQRHPVLFARMNLTQNLYPLVNTPVLAREMFYSTHLPAAKLERYANLLGNESYRAFLDMLGLNLPNPANVRTPLLVLGGAQDQIFSPAEVMQTAAAYGVTAQLFPNMAHNLMLENGWEQVAARMHSWLQVQGV